MSARATVELEGHIIDSLILAKVLDTIEAAGVEHEVVTIDIGRRRQDPSRARLALEAGDGATLDALVAELAVHGVTRVDG